MKVFHSNVCTTHFNNAWYMTWSIVLLKDRGNDQNLVDVVSKNKNKRTKTLLQEAEQYHDLTSTVFNCWYNILLLLSLSKHSPHNHKNPSDCDNLSLDISLHGMFSIFLLTSSSVLCISLIDRYIWDMWYFPYKLLLCQKMTRWDVGLLASFDKENRNSCATVST